MDKVLVKKIVGTLGVVLALLAAASDLFGPQAFWIGLAGLAMTAVGNVIGRYAGDLAVTVLGIVFAAATAVAPGLLGVNERWGRIGVLIGAIVAAIGKGIFDTDITSPPDPPVPPLGGKFVSLLLIAGLAFSASGARSCTKAQAESVQRKLAINIDRVASNVGNATTAIDYLRENKLISDDAAVSALLRLQQGNAANQQIITTLEKYIVVNASGQRELRLTDEGIVDVRKVIDEAAEAFNRALSDPVLNRDGNQSLSAISNAFRLALKAILEVRAQLQPATA
jgi:hypothetical protein